MLKRTTIALALSTAGAASALAAEPPASVEDCLLKAIGLAEASEQKTLSDDARTKIEGYLITLEAHCEASRFPEAATLIADIETALSGS